MHIEPDDLSRPQIQALLDEHLRSMFELSPPESVHALNIEQLKKPDVTFWSVWDGQALLGCGALKQLSATEGEVKSMRTAATARRRGAARAMLDHIIRQAMQRGYRQLYLETGTAAAFQPAQQLYLSAGFSLCPPFGSYVLDPHSVFMTKALPNAA